LDWYHKDRSELYFYIPKHLFRDYQKAVEIVVKSGHHEIGLYLGSDDYEYPFWALAQLQSQDNIFPAFRHVGVKSQTKKSSINQDLPQYVIATQNMAQWKYAGDYEAVHSSNYLRVYKKTVNANQIHAD
jgi:hypothetical protein